MADKRYIAIDLGAESGRVMLGTFSDSGLVLTEIHRFANIPIHVPAGSPNGTLHWNVLALWQEIKTGISKAAAVGEIAGVGVDTWGVDFALLDAAGNLLGNPVCYRDPRTNGMTDAVFARMPRNQIYAITGIQTLPINTLFQLASLSFGRSEQLAAAKRILFLPDLFTYWLAGRMATEYTIASTSQLLDAQSRQFSPEILGALGISPALFPPIDFPARRESIRGLVLPGVNESLAASQTPVIAVGSHDTASAVVAVPAQEGSDDWLYLSSGTWSLLGVEVDSPVLTDKTAEYNITNEGGVGNKIRLLKNIPGLWLLQECRRAWAAEGQSFDYAQLTALAEKSSAHGAHLVLSDPAFATPGNMPQKIASHCLNTKQPVPTSPGEFARVIFESLADTYALVIRQLEEVTGRRFTTLHIVGGGSRNDLLNQLAADATGLTVLAGPVEATALGNILAQAITTGHLANLAAGRAIIAQSFPPKKFLPRP